MRDMKDSGITFVGNIPNNWKVLKNKRCFELEKDIVGSKFKECQLLSLTKKGVILKDINNTYGKTPESYETYQSVKRGQLIMCLFDLDISAVFSGITDYSGMISPAYKIYNCKNSIYNRYAGYWFDFCFDGRKYMSFSKSLRYVVNTEDFKDIEITVPPLEQQYKIVQFLDKKIIEIDNVIEKTKETIEDYKLYKQTIISKAVTKGINKNCKMKKSGVMWIGNIPEHWKLSKFKYKTDIIMGQSPNGNEIKTEGSIPFMQGNKEFGTKYPSPTIYCETCNKFCRIGDILMSVRAPVGAINEADKVYGIGRGLCSIKVNDEYVKDFVKYYLIKSVNDLKYYSNGSVFEAITTEILNNFYLLEIPLTEQRDIVKYLDNRCDEIDDLISNKEKLITELESYKKSLIYEYVTGKKEVI